MGGSVSESPRKRIRRAKKHATPRDLTPTSLVRTVDNAMMELLLNWICPAECKPWRNMCLKTVCTL